MHALSLEARRALPAAASNGWTLKPDRFNVLAMWGKPLVTLSTHMDTVPPFFPSREDAELIWGRGSCDAKGIIASMIAAAEKLLADGVTQFRRCSSSLARSATAPARSPPRSRRAARAISINGEPTENKLALASKGALRFELIARGRLAHSAYPELGESAIEKLLDALEAIRRVSTSERPAAWAQHDEHRHHHRRPRPERDCRFRQSGNSGAAGGRSSADPRSRSGPQWGSARN